MTERAAVERIGVVRLPLQGLLAIRERLLRLSENRLGQAARVERGRVFGVGLDRLIVIDERVFVVVLVEIQIAAGVSGGGWVCASASDAASFNAASVSAASASARPTRLGALSGAVGVQICRMSCSGRSPGLQTLCCTCDVKAGVGSRRSWHRERSPSTSS